MQTFPHDWDGSLHKYLSVSLVLLNASLLHDYIIHGFAHTVKCSLVTCT